ncbi:MAG: methyl-accepting chemotaxis protein, partial [Lachnospiraceae bacterium]|nr:methyl-accepting chemotaxis protein [Lachnospiraceae bacterium]
MKEKKKKVKKEKKGRKVGFLHSIRFTITLLVMISVCLTTILNLLIVVPATKGQIKQSVQNNMLGLAGAYGDIVQNAIDNGATVNTNLYKVYKGLVGDCKIEGVESSYVYIVSADGTMQYHPTEEKVGQPVENVVVQGLVKEIKQGKHPEDAAVSYEFKGEMKYASYHLLRNKSILVVSADESEILAPMDAIQSRAAMGSVLVFICMCLFAFIVAVYISRPILKISDVIEQVAQFRFTDSSSLAKMLKRRDETGVMGRSVDHMCQNMRNMVSQMEKASENINQQANELTNISQAINTNCTDNSATTEQLAAGMQETSATTQNILANIDSMKGGVDEICDLTSKGEKLSQEITSRAEDMRQRTR